MVPVSVQPAQVLLSNDMIISGGVHAQKLSHSLHPGGWAELLLISEDEPLGDDHTDWPSPMGSVTADENQDSSIMMCGTNKTSSIIILFLWLNTLTVKHKKEV